MTEMIELYQSGLSLREVGLRVGIPFSKVYLTLKPLGIVRKRNCPGQFRFEALQKRSQTVRDQNPRAKDLSSAVELVTNCGYSFGKAADKLGLTRNDVAGAVYRHKRRIAGGMS
jgi:hypothetical protein